MTDRGIKRALSSSDMRWRERYGPWAVVTGATSGIGRAVAEDLARRGLDLVIAARRGELLDSLAQELNGRFGTETRTLAGDLALDETNDRLFAETLPLDVGLFVASAGFGTSGPLHRAQPDAELAMVDLNIRAVLKQTHHFAKRFAEQRRGGLVLLSSIVAWQGVPRASNYAATKAYVQSLAEALSHELGPLGVDVLASAPAQVASGFGARADMRMTGADPVPIARNTLDALGRRTLVIPHGKGKFLTAALAPLPRPLRVRVMATVMKGMTKHQPA